MGVAGTCGEDDFFFPDLQRWVGLLLALSLPCFPCCGPMLALSFPQRGLMLTLCLPSVVSSRQKCFNEHPRTDGSWCCCSLKSSAEGEKTLEVVETYWSITEVSCFFFLLLIPIIFYLHCPLILTLLRSSFPLVPSPLISASPLPFLCINSKCMQGVYVN